MAPPTAGPSSFPTKGQMHVREIARLADIFEHPPYPDIVAVDVPIGLLDAYEIGGRECDRKARRDLEQRGSSVFVPPIRAVLNARCYEEACAVSRASSKSLSENIMRDCIVFAT